LPNHATRITLFKGDANHLAVLTALPVEFSRCAAFFGTDRVLVQWSGWPRRELRDINESRIG
jgi:hypothetical protein